MNGIELKGVRESLHMTQLELAIALGVSPSSIARWEQGKTKEVDRPVLVENALRNVQRGLAGVSSTASEPLEEGASLDDPPERAVKLEDTEQAPKPEQPSTGIMSNEEFERQYGKPKPEPATQETEQYHLEPVELPEPKRSSRLPLAELLEQNRSRKEAKKIE